MPPQVLVTWPGYDPGGKDTGHALTRRGLGVKLAPRRGARDQAEVSALVAGCAGAIVSTDPFGAEVLTGAPTLRVIARVGVGTDSIDLEAATAAGIVVTVTPGANRDATADHAVALMLAALRRVLPLDAAVRRGEWIRGAPLMPGELAGTVVGIVGYGAIGVAVAERVRAFGAQVIASDPAVTGSDVELCPLDDLLRRAGVVTLHCPLTAASRRLIGARELARMRPGAILVNTSRGGLVDEPALVIALRDGRLGAAALDVFEAEPAVHPGLVDAPNVVMTPHVAGLSDASVRRMTAGATASVVAVLTGTPDPAVVANPEVLERLGPPLLTAEAAS